MRSDRPLLDYHWLAIRDNTALLTLLWGQPGEDRHRIAGATVADRISFWQTDIWIFIPGRMAELWGPGQLYPNGAMFADDDAGTLYGWHICRPRVIYGCGVAGDHRCRLELPLILETPLSPRMQAGTLRVQVDAGDAETPQWQDLGRDATRCGDARPRQPLVPNPWRFWPGPDEHRLNGFVHRHRGDGLTQRFDLCHWRELRAALGKSTTKLP